MPGKKKILLIDDEIPLCRMIKQNIEDVSEFKVMLAHNGEDGIALACMENPDVILLDVMMPVMDGLDVAEILKKDSRTKNIPVIFLTAIVKKIEIGVESMRKVGVQRYIAKPIETEKLIECINEVLKEQCRN